MFSYHRMCSLCLSLCFAHRCVMEYHYYRVCFLTTEYVFLLQSMFSYYRMCLCASACPLIIHHSYLCP